VREGERGIRIAACLTPKKAEPGVEQTEPQVEKRPVRFTTVSVFDRLSRVRSGGCRRRPRREIRCLPVSRLCCSSAPAPPRRGRLPPARSSRSRRPRATAQRRSRARLAGTPGDQKRADPMPRMPPPCPHTGNLATDGKSPKAGALHQERPSRGASRRGCSTGIAVAKPWLRALRCSCCSKAALCSSLPQCRG